MPLFISFFLLSIYLPSILSLVSPVSNQLHQLCLAQMPSTDAPDLMAAFVCGKDIQNQKIYEILQQTGLLHLIVVSGSHLLFLSSMMKPLTKRFPGGSYINFIVLCFYAGACRFEPPVFRFLLQFVAKHLNKHFRLRLSNPSLIGMTGLLTLVINPQWTLSLSFQLSWLAALAIGSTTSLWRQSVACYFLLLPLINPLSAIHPASIVINSAVAPIAGAVIFPLNVLAFFLPAFTPISDAAWHGLMFILGKAGALLPEQSQNSKIQINYSLNWLYIFVVQMLLELKETLSHLRTTGLTKTGGPRWLRSIYTRLLIGR